MTSKKIMEIHVDGKVYESLIDESFSLDKSSEGWYDSIDEITTLKIEILNGEYLVLNKAALNRAHYVFKTVNKD